LGIAPADLLVFRDDPTTDLSKPDSLEAVVANGRLYTEDRDGAIALFRESLREPGVRADDDGSHSDDTAAVHLRLAETEVDFRGPLRATPGRGRTSCATR